AAGARGAGRARLVAGGAARAGRAGGGGRPGEGRQGRPGEAWHACGCCGVLGAARTDILQTIFGAADGRWGGEIRLDGRPIAIASPMDAKRAGLSLVTEDRKFDGLVLGAGLDLNLALPSFERLSRGGFVSAAAGLARARGYNARP